MENDVGILIRFGTCGNGNLAGFDNIAGRQSALTGAGRAGIGSDQGILTQFSHSHARDGAMNRWPRLSRLLLLLVPALSAGSGCVERRFVIETNVPGAQVFVNNTAIGPSPGDTRWDYPGRYNFRAVAQGYEPYRTTENVGAKWYDYPPFDFFVENLWPFHIEDVRRFRFELQPAAQVRTDELLDAATNLRNRAAALPPSSVPDTPPPARPARPPATVPSPTAPQGPPAPEPLAEGLSPGNRGFPVSR